MDLPHLAVCFGNRGGSFLYAEDLGVGNIEYRTEGYSILKRCNYAPPGVTPPATK